MIAILLGALDKLKSDQAKSPSRERAIAITDLEKLIAYVSYNKL